MHFQCIYLTFRDNVYSACQVDQKIASSCQPGDPVILASSLEHFDMFHSKMAALCGKRVHGILFDFDNTLVPTLEANLYAFHKVKDKLLEFFAAKDAENIASKYQSLVTETHPWPPDSFKRGHHEWRVKLWETALSSEGNVSFDGNAKPSAAEMYELWRSARQEKMMFTEEITTLLQELAKDYKIAIVTNSATVIQQQKLAACGAEKFFKTIVISGDQAHPKPHPVMFHTACSLISVEPENCIMVGDSLAHDVQGGQNAGLMATVWIKLEGSSCNEGDPQPDFVVASVLNLPEILDELNSLSVASGQK